MGATSLAPADHHLQYLDELGIVGRLAYIYGKLASAFGKQNIAGGAHRLVGFESQIVERYLAGDVRLKRSNRRPGKGREKVHVRCGLGGVDAQLLIFCLVAARFRCEN